MNRSKEIIRTSCIGIACNILLSAFKFAVGIFANSVSIRTDALNNLTDALSSVITIVGTRLSEKEPDRKHPFGYGRIEDITSLLIGIIILYAGIEAIRHSVNRIIHPEPVEYTKYTLIIVTAAIAVKIILGLYTCSRGRKLESAALIASGKDALFDSVTSAATLIAALVYMYAGKSIEAYVGLAIALLIVKTGIDTIRETVSTILGERVDLELASRVKAAISSFPEVEGVFDLVIHSYGREKLIGSASIEVADSLTAAWIDNLQRAIAQKVMEDTGVEMLGLTIYAVNSKDEEAVRIRETIRKMAAENSNVIGIHGFYIDKVDRDIKFHVVTDYGCGDARAAARELKERIGKVYPDYNIRVLAEKDFAD
jgi:cation diffusion facilitator family transporter